MVRSFGAKTSRVFDLDAKSLQLLVARSGKAITDAEGILLQDLQAYRLTQLSKTQTFSGCVDLPPYQLTDPDCLVIPPFRALVGNELVMVKGTQNPSSPFDLNNLVYIPAPPTSSYAITVVYLEAWHQVLDESLTNPYHGFFPNDYTAIIWNPTTNPRYFYPYGNILANELWIRQPQFLDDLKDPLAGYTSGRVQLQYAIRTAQVIGANPSMQEFLKDFCLTHPRVGGRTNRPPLNIFPFTFAGPQDPGLYTSTDIGVGTNAANSSYKNVDGMTYAIPLCVVYQRNTGMWDPFTNAHGSAPKGFGIGSGRPDNKLATTVYPDDIIDTRSSFLGGSLEDYESSIKLAASRLWQGTLRLKLAEPPTNDTNAHQLGQTLLSQEFLGQSCSGPYQIDTPITNISANDNPHTCWTADDVPEIVTILVTQDMRNVVSPSSVWTSGDSVTLQFDTQASKIDQVTLYTTNSQAQLLRIPPAYIAVSGLGSNIVTLTWGDMGVDIRYDLGKPVWAMLSIKRPSSTEHLRFVPTAFHNPIYIENGIGLSSGRVSDFAQTSEEFTGSDARISLKSYKRNFSPNTFGTVRKVKVSTQSLIQRTADDQGISASNPAVVFNASSGSAATVTLSWKVSNVQRLILKNETTGIAVGEVPLEGSMQVRITQPTTFALYGQTSALTTIKLITQDVYPPTDLVSTGVLSGNVATRTYAYPGGALNPQNIYADYSVIPSDVFNYLSALPDGDMKNILLGCTKATLYRTNMSTGEIDSTDLQIRHQWVSDRTDNSALASYEVGVIGWFEPNPDDYIELEVLYMGMKTFHYNQPVQGITGVTETFAMSKNSYLFFNTAKTFSTYPYLNYPNSSMDLVISVPTNSWNGLQAGGVFEAVFGFNDQSFVFVKALGDTQYSTVPCTVKGLGTPLLQISIPQITLSSIDDVLIIAQATTTLDPASTTLFSYNYVPYQGEGDPTDAYTLTHLSDKVLVTTSGTGARVLPGITSTSIPNPMQPISSMLPAGIGWQDSDLAGASFQLSGAYSGTGNPAQSSTAFLETMPLSTVVGNIDNLLSGDGFPTLSPRKQTQRGFSSNTVAFAYVIDPPQIVSSNSNLSSVTYYVDSLNGVDTNSGLTRDTPVKSLQKLLNSLPAVITDTITINMRGGASLLSNDAASVNIIQEVPYGQPQQTSIYALIHTSFRTEGSGQVIVQKDPGSSRPLLEVPDSSLFPGPVYGWLHTSGKLRVDGFDLYANTGVTFASYPGSSFVMRDCAFEGGGTSTSPQLLVYGAMGDIASSSFANSTTHNIIVSSNASLITGDLSFSKNAAKGFTLIIEKNSVITATSSYALSGFIPDSMGSFGVEILVRQYSTLDTSQATVFTFPFGTTKLRNASTLRYRGTQWFDVSDLGIDLSLPPNNNPGVRLSLSDPTSSYINLSAINSFN